MSGARGATANAIALLALLAGTAVGCGDDAGDEPDCTSTLDEWCDEQGCDGVRTLDDALDDLLRSHPTYATYSECDEQFVIQRGDHSWHALYAYDRDSEELSGGLAFTFDDPHERCDEHSAGQRVQRCGQCSLIGPMPETATDWTPCQGDVAQPFLDACMSDPPEIVADCAECACTSCYPLIACDAPDASKWDVSLCSVLGARCVLEHCSDCAMLQAAADDGGVGDP